MHDGRGTRSQTYVDLRRRRYRLRLVVLVTLTLGAVSAVRAHSPAGLDSTRVIRAVRAAAAPQIDGQLDDAVWQRAPRSGGFTQRDPDEGAPPTETTRVQAAYDDRALYVGVTLHDSDPAGIMCRMARRDSWAESDRVELYLDAHHDHQTGCWFEVNAAGSLTDGHISDDGEGWGAWDDTWDGVWDARVSISESGWTVEYAIPYACLRFNPADEYTWGINLQRVIARKKERDYWVMVPRTENGFVSRFGHLKGIQGIEPTKALEFVPYVVGRASLAPADDPDDGEILGNLGGDVRYGISSAVSLNATINPDFGQVESDPAELNLSVFETFQEERRPFFLEGAQTFDTPIDLFYSRRIGRRPGYLDLPGDWEEVEAPDYTNILGAAKVTGKTAGKTSFGLLEAVTAQEKALAESTYVEPGTGRERAARTRFLTEPRANFVVGRLKQDLWQGNSHVGGLFTAVNREGAESAYTGGVDWRLKWCENAYEFSGQVAANRTETGDGLEEGWGTQFGLSKDNGRLHARFRSEAYSSGFEINDLGYQWRNDYYNEWVSVELNHDDPWWVFQRSEVGCEQWTSWNMDHVNLEHAVAASTWNQLRNFWEAGGWFMHRFESKDDLDTRGGPLIRVPASTEAEVWLESDSRKSVSGWAWFSLGSDTAGSYWRRLSAGITVRPGSRVEIELNPGLHWRHEDAQWVENVDDEGDDTDDHFVYAQLDSRTLDLTTRAALLFTRDLSLELYLQPFVSAGDYTGYKELARAGSYDFTPFRPPDDNPDFRARSLQSNLVFRWEYRPGSTVFLVWSQSRSRDYQRFRFRPLGDALSSFTDSGTDIFLVKLNYWVSR